MDVCPNNILDYDLFSHISSRKSPGYNNCGRMWCDYNCTTHCCAVWDHLCCASILEGGHFNVCYNMSILSFLCVLVLLGESEQATHG